MSSVVISGDTSGAITLQAPAVAGSTTLNLPASSGTIATDANGTLYPLIAGTSVASTSGTSIDFTGIPSWVKRITVIFNGVSLTGTDDLLVQLGVSGSYSATYASTCAALSAGGTGVSNSTTGFIVRSQAAASITSGLMIITNISGNTWVASYSGKQSTTVAQAGGGDVALSGTLTSVRITDTGTNTFDAGSINILYE